MRRLIVTALLVAGCAREAAPRGPEQELIARLGLLVTQGAEAVATLYDLEIRQKADLFDEIARAPGPDRLKILEAARPRLGEEAALGTLRAEIASEIGAPLRTALARGGCSYGPALPADVTRYAHFELPRPTPEMGPRIGQFLFDLHREIGYITSGRVSCPGGASAWLQLVKRKGRQEPLRILRIRT